MSKNKPFLVLGMAVNYRLDIVDFTPETLSVFVRSFQRYSDCDITLFTANLAPATMEWLHGNKVLTVELSDISSHPLNYRFLASRAFLAANPDYSHVFLTDVRDVVAQGDIFAALGHAPGMHIFLENKSLAVGDCPYNSGWVLEGYGSEWAGRFAAGRLSCVGTLFGDRLSALCYLSALNSQLLLPTPGGLSRLDLYGMDTAAHLYLYHSGELDRLLERLGRPLTVHENGSPVLNAAQYPKIFITEEDVILSPEGDRPDIVHQYDRFPPILKRMAALYPA